MSTEDEARDELVKVILTAYGEDACVPPCAQDIDLADVILAAGYRKVEAAPSDTDELRDAIDHVLGGVEFQDAIDPEAVKIVVEAARTSQPVQVEVTEPPCDGGCNYNSGPEETCSAHGRPVAEVWDIVQKISTERDRYRAALDQVGKRAGAWKFESRGKRECGEDIEQIISAALGGGGAAASPDKTPDHIPVHRLRYHRTEDHIWLECSIDDGPWRKVPSPYGDQSDGDRECDSPHAGMVAGTTRHAEWSALGGGGEHE